MGKNQYARHELKRALFSSQAWKDSTNKALMIFSGLSVHKGTKSTLVIVEALRYMAKLANSRFKASQLTPLVFLEKNSIVCKYAISRCWFSFEGPNIELLHLSKHGEIGVDLSLLSQFAGIQQGLMASQEGHFFGQCIGMCFTSRPGILKMTCIISMKGISHGASRSHFRLLLPISTIG